MIIHEILLILSPSLLLSPRITLQTFPQQERGKMMVKIGLLRKADSAEAANKCNVCWITKVQSPPHLQLRVLSTAQIIA